MIDIERFDKEPERQLFHGILGDLPEEFVKHPNGDAHKYAVAIVGRENVPARAMDSVAAIGKRLVGRPQLGSTIATGSGLLAYLIRQIVLGEDIKSSRYMVKFEELFMSKKEEEHQQSLHSSLQSVVIQNEMNK